MQSKAQWSIAGLCTVSGIIAGFSWYKAGIRAQEEQAERTKRNIEYQKQREEKYKEVKAEFDKWCCNSRLEQCPVSLKGHFEIRGDTKGVYNVEPVVIGEGEIVKIRGMLTVGYDIEVKAGGVLIADCVRIVDQAKCAPAEISAGRARGAYFKHPFNPDHTLNRSFYGGHPLLEFDPVGGLIKLTGMYDEALKHRMQGSTPAYIANVSGLRPI